MNRTGERTPEAISEGRPYVYFACSIALPELVDKELALIADIAKQMEAVLPDHTLLVRPYPILDDWGTYDEVARLPNVELDNKHRRKDWSVGQSDIYRKYDAIEQAIALLHLGTTMGLEAMFLDTPSLLLDFGYTEAEVAEDPVNLRTFIHQYQLEKYLIDEAPRNVVRDLNQLGEVLSACAAGSYESDNTRAAAQFPLVDFNTFARQLTAGVADPQTANG